MFSLFKSKKPDYPYNFHDDEDLHDNTPRPGKWNSNLRTDIPALIKLIWKARNGLSAAAKETLPELDINDPLSRAVSKVLVTKLWSSLLHPPLSYRGNKSQYRSADGSNNNILYPDLGKAGLPYAKTVQGTYAHPGAKPDPGDIFDLLMARNEKPIDSGSGISMMLLYHATTIIHDIFRTDDDDPNISATSSYLDLAPLYGNDIDNQKAVRQMKDGLLKPDTFCETRLLNQPPGVCIYLIMYNRFHNYVAQQLLTINENGRFSLPYEMDASTAEKRKALMKEPEGRAALKKQDEDLFQTARLITCGLYINIAIHDYLRCLMLMHAKDTPWTLDPRKSLPSGVDKKGLSRGEGNMVSVEFNLLYRFQSPISTRDQKWSEEAFYGLVANPQVRHIVGEPPTLEEVANGDLPVPTFKKVLDFYKGTADSKKKFLDEKTKASCWPEGLDRVGAGTGYQFKRDPKTLKFDDAQLAAEMMRAIEDPICQFGAQNVPKVLKQVEVLGMLQARSWDVASLNEFRDFFGMSRHQNFEDINSDRKIQNNLRELYGDPDAVELYPGLFLEGQSRCLDPGTSCPNQEDTALWRAVFSDAVTLVRSDRFYTLDWNVGSLTGWGMREVTSDPKINKGSVMHRLFQRAFPGYFSYSSVHLWQPFYTPTKNVVLAQEQGYVDFLDLNGMIDQNGKDWKIRRDKTGKVKNDFKAECEPTDPSKARKLRRKLEGKVESNWRGGEYATKTAKPAEVAKYQTIKYKILGGEKASEWVNPHIDEIYDIPAGTLRDILTMQWKGWTKAQDIVHNIMGDNWEQTFTNYFITVSQEIRLREQRKFQKYGNEQVLQIDIVKNYAIPVVTRFVADFLGFWHNVKTPRFKNRKYEENNIYQHFANCHNFEAYDSDPTKAWKRRIAFKKSMAVLKELTEEGIRRSEHQFLETGFLVFQNPRIYGDDGDSEEVMEVRKAAVKIVQALRETFYYEEVVAIMLSTALDAVQKIVSTFTETLAYFIDPKLQRNRSEDNSKHDSPRIHWEELQKLAWDKTKIVENGKKVKCDPSPSDNLMTGYILEASRFSHKSDITRMYKPRKDSPQSITLGAGLREENGEKKEVEITVSAGEIIVLNFPKAYDDVNDEKIFKDPSSFDHTRDPFSYLIWGTYAAPNDKTGKFRFSKTLAQLALRAMIKHTAHLKELRVAHDKAGRLKRVRTPDGVVKYANPQWDELLPFPTTWNLRFNGVGRGVYAGGDNAKQGHDMSLIWHRDKEVILADELGIDAKIVHGENKPDWKQQTAVLNGALSLNKSTNGKEIAKPIVSQKEVSAAW